MNLDEITTGPLAAVSDLIDLEESLTRSDESFAPWAEFDLSLIHANSTFDLKNRGAIVQVQLAIGAIGVGPR